MGRLVVHGGFLLALLTPAIASELPSSLHAALWPLSAPGSVYPSARITGLQKPQEVPANDGPIDFRSRFEGQEPLRALTPAQKEAIRAALSDARAPAAVSAINPREHVEVHQRAQQEQEQWLKRQERVGRRAITSVCDGCIGKVGVSHRSVPREYVDADGLAYREQDLR
jgi:hypothetical protein